jgi:alpha-L-fucosidase
MPITRRSVLGLAVAAPALLLPRRSQAQDTIPEIAKGPFNGAESLKQYRIPEWFRDYKFGMWAHWGPQSAAEFGDWYARNMYMQDSPQNKYHVQTYGHPSKVGFKVTVHAPVFAAVHPVSRPISLDNPSGIV